MPGPDVASGQAPLRVLVVEDHGAMSRGIELLLRREGMEVAGIASTVGQAERLLESRAVDVVVLDVDLHGEDGRVLIRSAHLSGARVLMYTGGVSDPGDSLHEAPDGAASKLGGARDLVNAIREVAAGGSPSDARTVAPIPPVHRLTARERQITGLLAEGRSGEEIAELLSLSAHTVRTHIRNAMAHLGANTRAHLIALSVAAGELSARDGAGVATRR
jgi:DNA-binding NarL/FixJ family response regulator